MGPRGFSYCFGDENGADRCENILIYVTVPGT